jgi:hypothetical protein
MYEKITALAITVIAAFTKSKLYPSILFLTFKPFIFINTSSLLLDRPRKKDNKKVIKIIHIEGCVSIITDPAITLKTNPKDIIVISMIGICFMPNEYRTFITIYKIKIYVKLGEKIQLTISTITTRKVKITQASATEINEDAIGLFFFLGCSLSSVTSIISLRIYTELAVNENNKNA